MRKSSIFKFKVMEKHESVVIFVGILELISPISLVCVANSFILESWCILPWFIPLFTRANVSLSRFGPHGWLSVLSVATITCHLHFYHFFLFHSMSPTKFMKAKYKLCFLFLVCLNYICKLFVCNWWICYIYFYCHLLKDLKIVWHENIDTQ